MQVRRLSTAHSLRLAVVAVLITTLLTGCATYHAFPLDSSRGPPRVADLTVPATSIPMPQLGTHPFDPAHGLDVTDIAMLAIANNPQLRVDRDAVGIAGAQAYAAGLLPDPAVSYEHDNSIGTFPPGTTNAYTASIAFDLGNLITRSARVRAARAGKHEVDLNLLWAEWQTVAQARILFDRVYFLRKQTARLQQEHTALAPLQASITHALRAGNLTYASASAGLNAASDTANQLADAERKLHLAEHDLHNLLGLDASVPLRLIGSPFTADPSAAQIQLALANMPKRRPDLLALQAGYRAADDKLRAAILAQFPAITVGFVRARDNGAINSAGLSIGLSLPIFNGNRGNIAVARATRQQLHDAYSARLLNDRNDVQRLAADLASDRTQRTQLVAHAVELTTARAAARVNFAAGRLDWPTYLAIRANSLAADTTLLTLDESTHAAAITLEALVGNWPNASKAHSRNNP